MVIKRGVFFLVLFLFLLSVSVSAASTITCDEEYNLIIGQGDTAKKNCTVSSSQTIDVKKEWSEDDMAPDIADYYAGNLTIKEGVKLWFINSLSPASSSYHKGGKGATGKDEGSNIPGRGASQSILGGAGGDGAKGDETNRGSGGAGGGGGAGAAMFYKGGFGGAGGAGSNEDGCNSPGSGGSGGEPTNAGANLEIHVKNLIMETKSEISVSGQRSGAGTAGTSGCRGGGGGAGAGGSGAGRITLYVGVKYTCESNDCIISAAGGFGGNSGSGGDDDLRKDNMDGSGSGSGGGGNCGEIITYIKLSDTFTTNITPGSPGLVSTNNGAVGVQGADGNCASTVQNEILKETTSPFFEGVELAIYCNDEEDNDNDGLFDMQDDDCWKTPTEGICGDNAGPYQGETQEETFSNLPIPLASAINGVDGCCGDDELYFEDYCKGPKTTCTDFSFDNCPMDLNCVQDVEHNKCVSFLETDSCKGENFNCVNYEGSGGCADELDDLCEGESLPPGDYPCPPGTGSACIECFSEIIDCDGLNEGECTYVNECSWEPSPPGETIILNCSDLNKINCDSSDGVCDWVDVSELSPDEKKQDLFYIDADLNYFCSHDYDNSTLDEPQIIDVKDVNAGWKWWDSKLNRPLTIHTIDHSMYSDNTFTNEIMSNGENWSICNASCEGDCGEGIIGNLDSITAPGGYTMNEMCPYVPIDSTQTNFFGSGYGVEDCIWTLDNDVIVDVCCVSDQYDNDELYVYNKGTVEYINYLEINGEPANYLDLFLLNEDPINGFPERCFSCYDANGELPGTSGQGSNTDPVFVLKDYFNFGSFMGDYTESCEDNQGTLCVENIGTEGYFCNAGYYEIAAKDLDPLQVCCFSESEIGSPEDVCSQESGNEVLSCAEQGGQLIPDEPDVVTCSAEIASNDNLDNFICCRGGIRWIPEVIAFDYSRDICYGEYGNSFFGECCYDTVSCKNVFDSTVISDFDNSNFFTSGSALHTIKSFDYYTGNQPGEEGELYDRVIVLTPSNLEISINNLRKLNLSEFDTLNFDIGFSGMDFPNNISLNFESLSNACNFNIFDYIIYNFSQHSNFELPILSNVWYRISIPLDSCPKEVLKNLMITTTGIEPNKPPAVFLDNFFLSNSSIEGFGIKNDNYYCEALSGQWLSSLNPDADDYDASKFETWGPNMYACNAQLSYGWTGKQCCGSLTEQDNYGEYYEDLNAGCFGGFTVQNGERLSDVLGNPSKKPYNSLIYYDNDFWTCNNESFDELQTSWLGVGGSPLLIQNETKALSFEIKGDWMCYYNGWMNLTEAQNSDMPMQILVATMKEKGEQNGGNYTLFCGNQSVLNNATGRYNEFFNAGENPLNKYCSLRASDEVWIGALVNHVEINDFLNKTVKAFFFPDHNLSQTNFECNDFGGLGFSNQEFYRPCPNQSDWTNISYNKPLGILIFNMADMESNGVPSNAGFFEVLWIKLSNFFESIFGSVQEQRPPTPIPASPEADDISFNQLYIDNFITSDNKNKTIIGMIETVDYVNGGEVPVMIIQFNGYDNVTDLRDLVEAWIEETDNSAIQLDYNLTNDGKTQFIELIGAQINNLDWRYLTAQFKTSGEFTSVTGNSGAAGNNGQQT